MNALLSLEPRVAGDATLEPDVDFTDEDDELHGAANKPTLFCTTDTQTYYCGETTHICL